MPRKNIVLEIPGQPTIHFADLRHVPMAVLAARWIDSIELNGTWRCSEGHEGHLVASIYQEHPPFFRHTSTGCGTCAEDEETAGESDEHKSGKHLIRADLEHIGWSVDEEYTFDGQRHRADVAAWDKKGQLHIVEVQRSYEPIQRLHVRDGARIEATGHPDRTLWVTDVERSRWKGHPLIVCDRGFDHTRTGLWALNALNPDDDPPVVIERGELLERWADGQVNRIEFPERRTPIGPESQWIDRSKGATTEPRKKLRKRVGPENPARATVCIPCDSCGARVTVAIQATHDTVLCASCAAAAEAKRQAEIDARPRLNDPTLPFCPYCLQGSAKRPAEWSQTPHQPGGCLSGMHRAHLDKVRTMLGRN